MYASLARSFFFFLLLPFAPHVMQILPAGRLVARTRAGWCGWWHGHGHGHGGCGCYGPCLSGIEMRGPVESWPGGKDARRQTNNHYVNDTINCCGCRRCSSLWCVC